MLKCIGLHILSVFIIIIRSSQACPGLERSFALRCFLHSLSCSCCHAKFSQWLYCITSAQRVVEGQNWLQLGPCER